jgi:parvulin-like peptidyl-prolyl isomerase
MNMKKLLILSLCGLFTVGILSAQSDLQPAAIVNLTKSEPITVKQFRTEVDRQEKTAGRQLNATERRQVLDVMINERLALQAAERDKLAVSENEVNQQLQQLRASMVQSIGRQPTDTEFATAVRNESGLEVPAFREQLRRQLLVQKYLLSKKQSVMESYTVPTEAEILNTYNLARSQFVRPETIRFSMIQVPFGSSAADRTKAKELADRLVRDISANPAKFDEAVLKGQVPNSGYRAGEAGYLPRNMEAQQLMGADFLNTAFSLKQGEVSKLIEGPQGYQIIKVVEAYTMKPLELDDIFQLGSRVTVRDYIGNVMLQDRQMAALQRATEELTTELRAGRTFQVFDKNINW